MVLGLTDGWFVGCRWTMPPVKRRGCAKLYLSLRMSGIVSGSGSISKRAAIVSSCVSYRYITFAVD